MARRPTRGRRAGGPPRRGGPQNRCRSCGYQWYSARHTQDGACPSCGHGARSGIPAVWLQVGGAGLGIAILAVIFFSHQSSKRAAERREKARRAEVLEERQAQFERRAEEKAAEAAAPASARPSSTGSSAPGRPGSPSSSEAEDEVDPFLEEANDKFGDASSRLRDVGYLSPERARSTLERCRALLLEARAAMQKSKNSEAAEQKELAAVIAETLKDCEERLKALGGSE